MDINKLQDQKLIVRQPEGNRIPVDENGHDEESVDETDDGEEISLLPSFEALKLRHVGGEPQDDGKYGFFIVFFCGPQLLNSNQV